MFRAYICTCMYVCNTYLDWFQIGQIGLKNLALYTAHCCMDSVGVALASRCILIKRVQETDTHLLSLCPFSCSIWKRILLPAGNEHVPPLLLLFGIICD